MGATATVGGWLRWEGGGTIGEGDGWEGSDTIGDGGCDGRVVA
jgi:hypothetical protein